MTDQNADLNSKIRAAAGYADPREVARAAIAAAERAGDASALRQRVAESANLPAGLASRLRGDDAGALADDARQLAEALGELNPSPPKSPRQELNASIRAAAGRGPTAAEADAEDEPVIGLDGGAHGRRSTAPPPKSSMNALLRGARDEKRERIAARASAYDD